MPFLSTFAQETRNAFRQVREVALLSGAISAAWVSSVEERCSGGQQVAVTCGEDGLVKVGKLVLLHNEPWPLDTEAQSVEPWVSQEGTQRTQCLNLLFLQT